MRVYSAPSLAVRRKWIKAIQTQIDAYDIVPGEAKGGEAKEGSGGRPKSVRTAVHRAISKFKAGVSSSSSCDDDDGESKGGVGARSSRGPAAPTGKVIRVGYIHKKGGGSSTFSRRNWKKRCVLGLGLGIGFRRNWKKWCVCDTRHTWKYCGVLAASLCLSCILKYMHTCIHAYMQGGVCNVWGIGPCSP